MILGDENWIICKISRNFKNQVQSDKHDEVDDDVFETEKETAEQKEKILWGCEIWEAFELDNISRLKISIKNYQDFMLKVMIA